MLIVITLVLAVLCPRAADEPRDVSQFSPSTHGFHFVNSFHGSPSPVPLGGLESRLGAPTHYGLCGGMSFAAADFFLARRAIPADIRQPAPGTPLFRYIQARQTASLGPNLRLIADFGRWMSAADDGLAGTRFASLGSIAEITRSLAAGKPTAIGLVYTRHANNAGSTAPAGLPWENHQVLAIGAKTIGTETTIRVYDPNYPGRDDVRIRCKVAVVDLVNIGMVDAVPTPILGVRCVQSVGPRDTRAVRGVFAMPYAPVSPPDGL